MKSLLAKGRRPSLKWMVMAGRNTASPLLRRRTSCSCSHSMARSRSFERLSPSAILVLSSKSDFSASISLPRVVSASRSVRWRLPGGRQPSKCSSRHCAAVRRRDAVSANTRQERCKVTRTVSWSRRRKPRLPLPDPSPRPSAAMPRNRRQTCSGRACAWPASFRRWVIRRRCKLDASPTRISGAASCSASIRACSKAVASAKRLCDGRGAPT